MGAIESHASVQHKASKLSGSIKYFGKVKIYKHSVKSNEFAYFQYLGNGITSLTGCL